MHKEGNCNPGVGMDVGPQHVQKINLRLVGGRDRARYDATSWKDWSRDSTISTDTSRPSVGPKRNSKNDSWEQSGGNFCAQSCVNHVFIVFLNPIGLTETPNCCRYRIPCESCDAILRRWMIAPSLLQKTVGRHALASTVGALYDGSASNSEQPLDIIQSDDRLQWAYR